MGMVKKPSFMAPRVVPRINPKVTKTRLLKRINIWRPQSSGFIMGEIALRQIRAIIAVCEEGSLTAAATRENATQSGISQHVAMVERTLGVKLFERSARGVKPTPAGQRYYKHCIEAVGQIAKANAEVRGFASRVTGDLRIGLIPTLTRAALAPTLEHFVSRYPDVRLHIIEGYSGTLTAMVQNGE